MLFNITVAKELVRPQIMKNLCRHLKFTINTALHQHPTQAQVGEVSTPDNRKRGPCHLCPRHRDLKTQCVAPCARVVFVPPIQKKPTVSLSPDKNKTNFFFRKRGMPTRC